MNNNYKSPEWRRKRKIILNRDNYTCIDCGAFNPMCGTVFRQSNSNFEKHDYTYFRLAGWNHYKIYSDKIGRTIEVDLHNCRFVFATMQVHHCKYVMEKNLWEYDDIDLVTLCKTCHTKRHEESEIAFFDINNKYLYSKKLIPLDHQDENDSDGEIPKSFCPKSTYFLFDYENEDEMSKIVRQIVDDFFGNSFAGW